MVVPSSDTYASLPVLKYELRRLPGFAAAAASIASSTPWAWVTSPSVLSTAMNGGTSPLPSAASVRWLAS